MSDQFVGILFVLAAICVVVEVIWSKRKGIEPFTRPPGTWRNE